MKALTYSTKRGLESRDVKTPKRRSSEATVKMRMAGICGTDLKIVAGKYYNPGLFANEVILGHEGVGEIVEIDANASGFKKGTKVVFDTIIPCWRCRYCKRDATNLCERWHHIGISRPGTFAELLVIPIECLHQTDGIPDERAALAEPVAIAVHSLNALSIAAGSNCAVVGCGPIGLVHALLLKHRGLKNVTLFGLENDATRLAIAKKCGLETIVAASPSEQKSQRFIERHREQFDVVIEAGGTPGSVDCAIALVRGYGEIRLLGLVGTRQICPTVLIRKNVRLSTGRGMLRTHLAEAVEVLRNRDFGIEALLTHSFPLEQFDEAFTACRRKKCLKACFKLA
jgi:2-desacetyl-2-hydroxyethyl bacteriochlorophyllide A dehydrogenase